MDRLGPDILSVLRMKGHVLRAHWKVPAGWWSVFKYASDEEVTYVFVAFLLGERKLWEDNGTRYIAKFKINVQQVTKILRAYI